MGDQRVCGGRVFMVGVALFMLASLMCGLAWSPAARIAPRAGPGVGAAEAGSGGWYSGMREEDTTKDLSGRRCEPTLGLPRAHRLQFRPRLLAHGGRGPAGRRANDGGGGLPPIVKQNAPASGTDVAGYLTESPGFSSLVRDKDAIYHTYSTTWRGLEFVMTYYPILDRAPMGRADGDAWRLWIRRHDEYQSE